MSTETMDVFHKKTAVTLFNGVWDLMEKETRSQQETDAMIHMAHASRYHWEQAGNALNLSRGEWQISRVYAILRRAEPALYHAHRNLEICLSNEIRDFDLAYAYEALARAYLTAGDGTKYSEYMETAILAAGQIEKEENRTLLENDLNQLKLHAAKLGW